MRDPAVASTDDDRMTGSPRRGLARSLANAASRARVRPMSAADHPTAPDARTGHSKQVSDAHYAKPFRDAEERKKIRQSVASKAYELLLARTRVIREVRRLPTPGPEYEAWGLVAGRLQA